MIKISSFHFWNILRMTDTAEHTHAAELFKQSEHRPMRSILIFIGHCFRLPLIVCSCDCDGIINFASSHIVIVGSMFIFIVYFRYKKENI